MGIGDLTGMFGKMQEIQTKLQQAQEELRHKTVEASSGGDMVTAKVNGKGELLELKIHPQAIDVDDLEMLEDLIKAAVNAAVKKSHQLMKEELGKLTGGINLPGMDQLGKMLR